MVVSLPSNASELLAVSEHTEEVETTHVPVETFSVNPSSQGCPSHSGLVGMEPLFPLASQLSSGLPEAPSGFVDLVPPFFPLLPSHPQVPLMGSDGAFPLLATGSVRLVISLPSLQPRSAVANHPPPSSTGPSQLPLGAVSDPSHADEVKEEMDAPYSMLHATFSEAGVGQDSQPSDPSTPPDLQLYDHIFNVTLADLGESELLVWDLPKPHSFWELDQESRSNRGLGP